MAASPAPDPVEMKRQQDSAEGLGEEPRREPAGSQLAAEDIKTSPGVSPQRGESSGSLETDGSDGESTLPDCWTVLQYNYFKDKYDGLVVSNKRLGCEFCSEHSFTRKNGVHVSKEWKHCRVTAAGTNKRVQQSSLRKKMKEHFASKAHAICRENIKQREQYARTKTVDNVAEKYLSATCRIFNTVYSLAQRCKPFSDIEDEIELQVKNGLDMGISLHSHETAVQIVDFIAHEIKRELFSKIIEKDRKLCLILDEASTVSYKPVVTVSVKVEGSVISPTVFVELVELESQEAETIFTSVMESLSSAGFTKEYLEKNVIGFCSNGASVMLGRKSGVSARVAREFPHIAIESDKYAIPDCIQKAKNLVRTIVVNSAEAERDFSNMNFVCFEKRNYLTVSNISNIMTVSLVGLPIKDWDPVPVVKKWLEAHCTANDLRIILKESESEEDANEAGVWRYLE